MMTAPSLRSSLLTEGSRTTLCDAITASTSLLRLTPAPDLHLLVWPWSGTASFPRGSASTSPPAYQQHQPDLDDVGVNPSACLLFFLVNRLICQVLPPTRQPDVVFLQNRRNRAAPEGQGHILSYKGLTLWPDLQRVYRTISREAAARPERDVGQSICSSVAITK